MIHLTLTGFFAGQTLCGAPRGEENCHAEYVNFKAPWADRICPDCKKIWESEDE